MMPASCFASPERGGAERSEAEGFGQTTRLTDADRRSASCRSAVPKQGNGLPCGGVGGRCQTNVFSENYCVSLPPQTPPSPCGTTPLAGGKSNRGPKNMLCLPLQGSLKSAPCLCLASPERGGGPKDRRGYFSLRRPFCRCALWRICGFLQKRLLRSCICRGVACIILYQRRGLSIGVALSSAELQKRPRRPRPCDEPKRRGGEVSARKECLSALAFFGFAGWKRPSALTLRRL